MEQKGQKIRAENEQITNHPFQIENEKFLFFFSLSKNDRLKFQSVVYYPPTRAIRLPYATKEKTKKKEKTQPLSIDPQAS